MRFISFTPLLFLSLAQPVAAGDLIVDVTNIQSAEGEIGCTLHPEPDQFPMGQDGLTMIWQDADPAGVQCQFTGLTEGTYAVAVSHDLNGNRKTDTNFLGIPKEAWGVTNNVRPRLRAPRFEEAQMQIGETEVIRTEIRIDR